MSELELSTNFTNIYKELESYTYFVKYKFNQKLETNIVLSELYLHLFKYKDEIKDVDTLASFSKKYIKSNLLWTNTTVKKETVNIKRNNVILDNDSKTTSSYFELSNEYIETKMNEFYNTLNRYDKGLYNIYYNLLYQNSRQIAEHLNISRTSGYNTLLECKSLENRLKDYLLKYI